MPTFANAFRWQVDTNICELFHRDHRVCRNHVKDITYTNARIMSLKNLERGEEMGCKDILSLEKRSNR